MDVAFGCPVRSEKRGESKEKIGAIQFNQSFSILSVESHSIACKRDKVKEGQRWRMITQNRICSQLTLVFSEEIESHPSSILSPVL